MREFAKVDVRGPTYRRDRPYLYVAQSDATWNAGDSLWSCSVKQVDVSLSEVGPALTKTVIGLPSPASVPLESGSYAVESTDANGRRALRPIIDPSEPYGDIMPFRVELTHGGERVNIRGGNWYRSAANAINVADMDVDPPATDPLDGYKEYTVNSILRTATDGWKFLMVKLNSDLSPTEISFEIIDDIEGTGGTENRDIRYRAIARVNVDASASGSEKITDLIQLHEGCIGDFMMLPDSNGGSTGAQISSMGYNANAGTPTTGMLEDLEAHSSLVISPTITNYTGDHAMMYFDYVAGGVTLKQYARVDTSNAASWDKYASIEIYNNKVQLRGFEQTSPKGPIDFSTAALNDWGFVMRRYDGTDTFIEYVEAKTAKVAEAANADYADDGAWTLPLAVDHGDLDGLDDPDDHPWTWCNRSPDDTSAARNYARSGKFTDGNFLADFNPGGKAARIADAARSVEIADGTRALLASDGTRTADLCDGAIAGTFADGTCSVDLCDGVDAIYAQGNIEIAGTTGVFGHNGGAGVTGDGFSGGIKVDAAAAKAHIESIYLNLAAGGF